MKQLWRSQFATYWPSTAAGPVRGEGRGVGFVSLDFSSVMTIKISDQFDGGAIELVRAMRPADIELKLRKDSHAEVSQWFYFRLQGACNEACTMRILNAGQATYPDGWVDYQAVASYDRETWFRVPTDYDGQVLTIRHTPQRNSVYYAYFAPYSWERHLRLLGLAENSGLSGLEELGSQVDGRALDMMVVGITSPVNITPWRIARQYPGES